MHRRHIFQSKRVRHRLRHAHLLADAVNQVKPTFRKHDGKRNAGETAARADVHYFGVGAEVDYLGYAQGMKHMVGIKVVDILARDDVNLCVPVAVERIELSKAFRLLRRKVRKIFLDKLHINECQKVRGKADK